MKQAKSLLRRAAVDVSARELVVAMATDPDARPTLHSYANTTAGHRPLLQQLTTKPCAVRVAMEATGVYGLSLALRLQAATGVAVLVINPRAVTDFLVLE
jgi:transposase